MSGRLSKIWAVFSVQALCLAVGCGTELQEPPLDSSAVASQTPSPSEIEKDHGTEDPIEQDATPVPNPTPDAHASRKTSDSGQQDNEIKEKNKKKKGDRHSSDPQDPLHPNDKPEDSANKGMKYQAEKSEDEKEPEKKRKPKKSESKDKKSENLRLTYESNLEDADCDPPDSDPSGWQEMNKLGAQESVPALHEDFR